MCVCVCARSFVVFYCALWERRTLANENKVDCQLTNNHPTCLPYKGLVQRTGLWRKLQSKNSLSMHAALLQSRALVCAWQKGDNSARRPPSTPPAKNGLFVVRPTDKLKRQCRPMWCERQYIIRRRILHARRQNGTDDTPFNTQSMQQTYLLSMGDFISTI